ncbi:Fur family transcriptional regulator [Caenispirillum salinarum]|uniref:Fur family transcriptional regulator n=1 Tax=Caenispirillum salinarum TaxID=859058 RepID=UPI00384ECF4A
MPPRLRTAAPFPAPDHDHAACVAHGLDAAEARCAEAGARLTPLRKRVLELLLAEGHRAVGAYDLLDRLAETDDGGKRPAPPAVYRALDFLVDHGLAHRLASVNAFIGCAWPDAAHRPQFLICRDCRAVAELDAGGLARNLDAAAEAAGFTLLDAVVEVDGLCPRCRSDETPDPDAASA